MNFTYILNESMNVGMNGFQTEVCISIFLLIDSRFSVDRKKALCVFIDGKFNRGTASIVEFFDVKQSHRV